MSGMSAFFAVAFEVVHFTSTTSVDPGVEEVGMGRFANWNDVAIVEAEAAGFSFDAGGEGG